MASATITERPGPASPFKVGDRVRVIRNTPALVAGGLWVVEWVWSDGVVRLGAYINGASCSVNEYPSNLEKVEAPRTECISKCITGCPDCVPMPGGLR